MSLHFVAPVEGRSPFMLSATDCVAAARRRRRNLFILLGLSALSWLPIVALIVAIA